jgi:hypothetical protein
LAMTLELTYSSLGCNESTPDGLLLGLHDVFHYCKSCSLRIRVPPTALTSPPAGHGVLLHVPERQLCRPALLQRKIRSRDWPKRRGSHGTRNPDQVAVVAFPSRTVWCFCGSASRRPRYQPIGLPMDDTACSVHDERYHLHHLLRKS